MNHRLLRAILVVTVVVIAHLPDWATAQEGRRLRAGYASLSGNMVPYWAAKDAGLYKKYGLDIDLIAFPSGNEGMAAMIAGEIEFIAIAGSTTASAAIGGSDVVSLAITTERLVTSLMTIPSIQRPEELKGKAVGISRFGTSIDTAARMAIQHFGLEPIRDVSLVQAGAVSANLAAMRGGRIQAAILSYPSIIQARREGYRELLDIASLGVPYASTGITVRKSFMGQRRDVVVNYMKSILEATARIKRDKAFTIDIMMKYFRTKDREMMDETYEVSVNKYLRRVPTPTAESFRTVVDELSLVNPKAKGQDPKRFYDDSILQELDKSGFIGSLNR
ncbi:MAG TPA: ABC transporter substrate-binding protein [Candidatus Binatia bacterium]|nr:ABC transporter substrate-binding protein [Candidatus Binatia bacterium]